MRLVLASASPRRVELLRTITEDFEIIPSSFEEKGGGDPVSTVSAFARGKAENVFQQNPNALVLGADTVVALDGVIFGKPKDEADARRMLKLLSGRTHSVYTGVCLLGEKFRGEVVSETKVTFYSLTDAWIEEYLQSGSPYDKAGAYGIQDGGLVSSYEGSYTNVVGLPVDEVKLLLEEAIGGNEC